MHDISTNSAPQNICDLFTCSSDLHTHNTRFSDAGNLYINKSRLRIQLNSFSIFGAKLWSCLKPDLRKLRKQPFKTKIHQFLLAVLGNEDDYVDVSTLMLKITHPASRASFTYSLTGDKKGGSAQICFIL